MQTACVLWWLALLLVAQSPQTPTQTPSGEPIYKVGSETGVKPAKPLHTPQPEYSEEARRKRIEGALTVEGYIGTDGKYHNVKVIVPLEKSLDDNALAAVKKWKFSPCTKDDKPVNCNMQVEISYHLR